MAPRCSTHPLATAVIGTLVLSVDAFCAELPSFDFTKPGGAEGWKAEHDVARMEATAEGLAVEIGGGDPYIIGPSRDFPAGMLLFVKVRFKSDQAGSLQMFYGADGFVEERSLRFAARGGGDWEEGESILPALGPKCRFRIDPPGTGGKAVLAGVWFRERAALKEPEWPKPAPPELGGEPLTLKSGALQLVHARNALGGFVLRVAGKDMACGHARPLIGYLHNGEARWVDVARSSAVIVEKRSGKLEVSALGADARGATWRIQQSFSEGKEDGVIGVETRVTVSAGTDVFYLPLLAVLPGAGSFGEKKGQGLFAGLEYLEDEPSSSEADVTGPASKRQVPDVLKITFPLMAIQHDGRYVGLIWEPRPSFAPLFDSPDRIFRSGGHLMGVLFPGSDGRNRVEGSLLPHRPERLAANEPLVLNATLIGGKGESVIPAVQQYVALRGLPPVPHAMDFQSYASLAAGGWLDSKIREDALYRHAFWPGFNAQPAADAAVMMDWLASQTTQTALRDRLRAAARDALAKVKPDQYNGAAISHVRYPVGALCYGQVSDNAKAAANHARGMLKEFQPDGSVLYKKSAKGPDYGRTHWSKEANGLAAPKVVAVLEAACVSGDVSAVRDAVRVLRALDKFDNTVPRGAQTWEVPLHTPDILASAYLVRAYVRGYELTGEREMLDRAEYWAWTGVPFVYLEKPTPQPVGTYATIAVLGATNWQAPVWFGQPVQWCGLVYSDALYGLSHHVPRGPWKQIADGITACGIQFTWKQNDKDRQGLLPDFYHLRQQLSDGPAINPGTVQANATRLFDRPPLYSFYVSRPNGWYIHAPGTLAAVKDRRGRVSLTVQSWCPEPCCLLVSGLDAEPRVRLNDTDVPLFRPHQFVAKDGWLVLQLTGSPKVEIQAH